MTDALTFIEGRYRDRETLLRSVAECFFFGAGQRNDDVAEELRAGLTAEQAASEAIAGWGLGRPGIENYGTADRSHMEINKYDHADLAAAMRIVMDRVMSDD